MELAPTCAENDSVIVVWELFRRQRCEKLVVVSEEGVPVGIISLQNIVSYLFPHHLTDHSSTPTAALNGIAPRAHLRQELHQISLELGQVVLEPLATLPVHWSLEELQPYLNAIADQQWALVDATGKYLGLLNQLRLWQWLALSANGSKSALAQEWDGWVSLQRRQTTAFQNNLPSVTLDPLLRLLERLPLPLMLQTSGGQVLSQNQYWRQQIGELQNPHGVRQEAGELLEAIAPSESPTSETNIQYYPEVGQRQPLPEISSSQGFSASQWANLISGTTSHLGISTFCRLGTNVNTCICVCPMKNGQERVWQFVKIPLGAIANEPSQDWAESSSPTPLFPSLAAKPRFHLGALGLTAEQSWEVDKAVKLGSAQGEDLWLVLAQDTTEQQQVAKELAAKNADLIQLNRLKDEFLACISHELKTPLTAVLGLSNLLKEQQLGALNEHQLRYAQLIYQSGRHLILIVNNILDLTRIETGQLELVPEYVKLETVCARAYEQAKQLLSMEGGSTLQRQQLEPEPELQFTLEIQPGLESIVADELRLRQMLANLLSNALKFTEPEGSIGLKVESWEGWIAFTVWDTGIGIAADKQHLIFQKFQQLENPLTRRFEGTGLGLVLTQRLARLHGGDITFTSVEGQGSQFTILLPPSPPQPEWFPYQQPAIPAVDGAGTDRLVVIVESVPQLLQHLGDQLTDLGYRLAIARSGTEALEKVRRLQPAVVFLNPLLPSLSGWDVLTLLKSDHETCHTPVIVTATHADRNQAYANGADGFLSLPIQSKALQHNLDTLIVQPTGSKGQELTSTPTVLYLNIGCDPPSRSTESSTDFASLELHRLFYPHPCRILEVDDLNQADLLARVWKPDVMLLSGSMSDPVTYLEQLKQYPFLGSLPLVTLTPEITRAANQVPGLSVFPCLAPLVIHGVAGGSDQPETSALLQVIRVAAGMNWMPYVLIVDFAALPANQSTALPTAANTDATVTSPQRLMDWLQAFGQYVQTAGLRSSVGYSWADIVQRLQHQSVDLLLICLRPVAPTASPLAALETLAKLEHKPPILVWDCCPPLNPIADNETQAVRHLLAAIATQVLPSSLSMQELLEQIQQTLAKE